MSGKALLQKIRKGEQLSGKEELLLIVLLSIPAIIAQLSSILMQYIDASMVGRIGTNPAASIGLVASSTWLFGSIAGSLSLGFSVICAQRIGAEDFKGARRTVRIGINSEIIFTLVLALVGIAIHNRLPVWLKGGDELVEEAAVYFMIYSIGLPVTGIRRMSSRFLACSGSMKTSGILNSLTCFLDIVFNYIFIFVCDFGAAGAALGTVAAEFVSMFLMLFFLFEKNEFLSWRREEYDGPDDSLVRAIKISLPIAFENAIVCGAQITVTTIAAPLGAVAVAANSFGVTVESLCYMPGYGISEAASTSVGQSIGAKAITTARRLGMLATLLGMELMIVLGALLYLGAPFMMGIITPDPDVIELGAEVLRIEAFAEPFYVASIIITGVFRGEGDTLIPSIMNLISLWAVRIPLSFYLVKDYGLHGIWMAMCIELIFRGLIFIIREVWKYRVSETRTS